jgi:undecaprenyl-diphosphatase
MNFPSFDTELLLAINQLNNIFLDGIMLKFSDTLTWSLMLIVVVLVVLKDRPFREAILVLIGMALCVLLADQISSSLIKPLVARLRPTHEPSIMFQVRCISGRAGLYGFVSSHAANTFAIAVFLAFVLRHRTTSLCLMLWASIVGFSRIYLGVHYPLDVVAGSLLGIVVGIVVYTLYFFVIGKCFKVQQQYYSNAYTSSGYQVDDIYIVLTSMALTLIYTFF